MNEPVSRKRRYLALWFPHLPADRQRSTMAQSCASHAPPEPPRPLVFIRKEKGALRLAAVDTRAQSLGLVPGLALADARARVPDLATKAMDEAGDAAWLERLADGCLRYTPMVALDPPDGLLLDIAGCAHLYQGEEALMHDIRMRLTRIGMEVRHAFAATPEGAHALARFARSGEADVRRLPVEALELDAEAIHGLKRVGLGTIGDVAARQQAAIAARFGEETVTQLRHLLGEENRPLAPRLPEPAVIVERRFAEPVARSEDALSVFGELMCEAACVLEQRGQGGRAFAATLFRSDGLAPHLIIETGCPTRDPSLLVRLLRERIDTLADPIDPGFGFDMVRLAVLVAEPLAPEQLETDGRAREESDLAALLDRLGVRLGTDHVVRLRPCDTHIPERAQFAVSAASGGTGIWPATSDDGPPERPILLFDPPEPVEVIAEVPDGPPQRFRWCGALYAVHLSEGPERIASEWWRRREGHLPGKGGRTRDYYRVEDESGRRFWLFRHGLYAETDAPRWYLHGLFA